MSFEVVEKRRKKDEHAHFRSCITVSLIAKYIRYIFERYSLETSVTMSDEEFSRSSYKRPTRYSPKSWYSPKQENNLFITTDCVLAIAYAVITDFGTRMI